MDAWNTRSDAKWEGNLDGVDCFSEVLFGKLCLLAYRSFFWMHQKMLRGITAKAVDFYLMR
ncbi:MAG: hypothetical protein ACON5D_19740 [Rubripirellula sp.]